MDKIFSVSDNSEQATVVPAEFYNSSDNLTSYLRAAATPSNKAFLKAVAQAYLPIVNNKIDALNQRLCAAGEAYTAAMYNQRAVQESLNTIVAPAQVNNILKQTNQFSSSTSRDKANWISYLGTTTVAGSATLQQGEQEFLRVTQDAINTSDKYRSQAEFYDKYAAHLRNVQDRLNEEKQALLQLREVLIATIRIID